MTSVSDSLDSRQSPAGKSSGISTVHSAAALSAALSADPIRNDAYGNSWHVRCPAHADGTPSLHVYNGHSRVVAHCHAGCTQEAVLRAMAERGVRPGPLQPNLEASERPARQFGSTVIGPGHQWAIAKIVREAQPIAGTDAEFYLRLRHISVELPGDLRFHPRLLHSPTGEHHPAMIAMVRDIAGNVVGVHRTFLAEDGRGKLIHPVNKMLLGGVTGCAVHLDEWQVGRRLIIAEGIETALSVRERVRELGWDDAVWSALSTAGLKSLEVPTSCRDILIAGDNDTAGRTAANIAARRWEQPRRRVAITYPKPEFGDFNDALAAVGGDL